MYISKPENKIFSFKTEIKTGNPLICKRIAASINVSCDVIKLENKIIYENEDLQIEYSNNFVDYIVNIYFKNLDNSKMANILLKLMDAMALEPDYPTFNVIDINTGNTFLLPYTT